MYDILRAEWTVTMEVHLGLTADHERQMFHDLNNLGKRVEESLAYKFETEQILSTISSNTSC